VEPIRAWIYSTTSLGFIGPGSPSTAALSPRSVASQASGVERVESDDQ
jgi:hypothetical protein